MVYLYLEEKQIDKKMTFVSFLHKEPDNEDVVRVKTDKALAEKSNS